MVVMVKYVNVTSYFKEKHQTNTLHFISFDLSKWLLKYDSLKGFFLNIFGNLPLHFWLKLLFLTSWFFENMSTRMLNKIQQPLYVPGKTYSKSQSYSYIFLEMGVVPVSEFLKSVKFGLKWSLFVNTFLPVTSKLDELETNFFLNSFSSLSELFRYL